MELWQMDIVGRFHLCDGSEVKVVTGVDDHSDQRLDLSKHPVTRQPFSTPSEAPVTERSSGPTL
jgi:hypothetical protein